MAEANQKDNRKCVEFLDPYCCYLDREFYRQYWLNRAHKRVEKR